MAINSRQWLSRKRIVLVLIIAAILIATFSLLSPKAPEQQVLRGEDDFFQRYNQTVSELRNSKMPLPAMSDRSSGRLASQVITLALHYAIEPDIHSSSAELLELSVARATPDAIIQWLAVLRVNYQLHISSIRIILSEDRKMLSIPEMTLIRTGF